MKQSEIFLQSEGQAWYERNKDKLPPEHDPVMEIIEKAGIVPDNVLEFGCGNGWRLDALWNKYACNIQGIDPYARWPNVKEGTAADGPYIHWKSRFDLVIYGFCLYLVDRVDLFKVMWIGDYYLKDGGYLVIHDFIDSDPHKRKYKHRDGIFSYHMNYSELWLANPAYSLHGITTNDPVDDTGAIMLKKDIEKGWPLQE